MVAHPPERLLWLEAILSVPVVTDACILLTIYNMQIEINDSHAYHPLGCEVRNGGISLNGSERWEPGGHFLHKVFSCVLLERNRDQSASNE